MLESMHAMGTIVIPKCVGLLQVRYDREYVKGAYWTADRSILFFNE